MTLSTDQDNGGSQPLQPGDRQSRIFSIVFAYAAFASSWILLSDRAVVWLFADPSAITMFSTVKGLLFVFITSLLLLGLMKRLLNDSSQILKSIIPTAKFRLTLPLILIAAAIFTLTASAIFYRFDELRNLEILKLEAIANQKTLQIDEWLKNKLRYAEFLQISQLFDVDFEIGKPEAIKRLETRLEKLRLQEDFTAILLLDSHAETLKTAAAGNGNLPPASRHAALQALNDHRIRLFGPYFDKYGRLNLDIITPLTTTDGEAFLAVLQTGSTQSLSKTLQTWPEPKHNGKILLFRQADGQIEWLFEAGREPGAPEKSNLADIDHELLSLPKPDGNTKTARLIQGNDEQGIAFLAWAQSIPETDWFLLAKQDRSELYAEALQNSILIALTGLMALLMSAAGFFLLHQRQQLSLAANMQASQESSLRALGLLAAIADSSDDAIFAKDLQGRYTLFNPAACRFVGKPAEQVLGNDDSSLFPPEQAEFLLAYGEKVISEKRILTKEENLLTALGERVFMATKGPLCDAEGKVIGLFGISRDITERKLAELQLRTSEERLKLALEATNDGLWDWDLNRGLAYLTPRYYELTGYRAEDVIADFDFFKRTVHPDDLPEVLTVMDANLQGMIPVSEIDYRLVTSNGVVKWIRGRGKVVERDANGKALRMVGTITDIDKHKAVETAIHRQTEELANRNAELERFNRAAVGRELDMIALKKQVNGLLLELGREPLFPLAFLDKPNDPSIP